MKALNESFSAEEIQQIKDILVNSHFVEKKGANLVYEEDYFSNYDLEPEVAYEILQSHDPRQAFNDFIFDNVYYMDWYDDILMYLAQYVVEAAQKENLDWNVEDIRDELPEIVDVVIADMDTVYKASIPCRLVLNTGDANTDFSDNPCYNDIGKEGYTMPDTASLKWLCEQIGVDVNKINNIIATGAVEDTSSLNNVETSIVEEITNTSTYLNATVFLISVPFENLLDLKEQKTIVLPANVVCGLYDMWNGAGGPLEIVIPHTLTVPVDVVWEFVPDVSTSGEYSAQEIYGLTPRNYTPVKFATTESVAQINKEKLQESNSVTPYFDKYVELLGDVLDVRQELDDLTLFLSDDDVYDMAVMNGFYESDIKDTDGGIPPRFYTNYLLDLVDEEVLNAYDVVNAIIKYMSEDELQRYMEIYELTDLMDNEEDEPMDENKSMKMEDVDNSVSYETLDHAEVEIFLWSVNTIDLQPKLNAIISNLRKKYNKGTYDKEKAIKAWEYLVLDAINLYNKEFEEEPIHLSVAQRRRVAQVLRDRYEEDVMEQEDIMEQENSMKWQDAYEQFEKIIDKYFPDENKIIELVDKLYAKHKGEEAWDIAYKKWNDVDVFESAENLTEALSGINSSTSLQEFRDYVANGRDVAKLYKDIKQTPALKSYADMLSISDSMYATGEEIAQYMLEAAQAILSGSRIVFGENVVFRPTYLISLDLSGHGLQKDALYARWGINDEYAELDENDLEEFRALILEDIDKAIESGAQTVGDLNSMY